MWLKTLYVLDHSWINTYKRRAQTTLIDGPLTMQPRFQSNMPSNRRFIQRRLVMKTKLAGGLEQIRNGEIFLNEY